ncbi:hypothetical protein D3227_17955 [Mesorhizobium waimense]|uniref:Uncharacterized protein n=1 Tax=Mesorhizobium waimense TaxID=1300307 RepID=A0A3A5KVS2_9HYPH|nr:hypothetical protein [Mesorhizobium waimense]RJT37517.1 hypothetical protein D3227_17955 [Mesorhizobium waimense]
MDTVPLIFYAMVCGALGAVAPSIQSTVLRVAAGGVTGLVSALVLPFLRGAFGYMSGSRMC